MSHHYGGQRPLPVCPSANVPLDKSDMSVKCLVCPHRVQTKPFVNSHAQCHLPVAFYFGAQSLSQQMVNETSHQIARAA